MFSACPLLLLLPPIKGPWSYIACPRAATPLHHYRRHLYLSLPAGELNSATLVRRMQFEVDFCQVASDRDRTLRDCGVLVEAFKLKEHESKLRRWHPRSAAKRRSAPATRRLKVTSAMLVSSKARPCLKPHRRT